MENSIIDKENSLSHLNKLENLNNSLEEEEKKSSEKKKKDDNEGNYISYIDNISNESKDDISELSFLSKNNDANRCSRDKNKEISINLKEAYFRFIPKDEKMDEIFKSCNYIPLIRIEGDQILFHDGKENGYYFNLNQLIDLINNNQIFIESDKVDIINNAYICKNHKKNYFKFCLDCKLHICEDEECLNDHEDHKLIGKNENIGSIIKIVQRRANNAIKSINNKYIKKNFLKENIKKIHCLIKKKIIKEKIKMDKENKFNYYIEKNIIDSFDMNKNEKEIIIEISEKNKNKTKIKDGSILWITEFFSMDQIKNNINQNKNIWISVCSYNLIILFSFNVRNDTEKYDLKKDFIEIKRKNIDIERAKYIMRLDEIFNPNDKNNNYFLIGSFNRHDSTVISVSLDCKTIEEVQKINCYGLMYSLVINHYNKKYLLQNDYRYFKIWTYGKIPAGKKYEYGLKYKLIYSNIKKEELKTHLMKNDISIIIYHYIISFIENKHLLIIHHYYSESYLRFYKIEETKELSINIIGELKPKKNQNKFSNDHNNCCIINNKYLIIAALSNKNNNDDKKENKEEKNKYGGFYVINLDSIEIIYYYSEKHCKLFKSIINFQNNMFICCTGFNCDNNRGRNCLTDKKTNKKLILYEFIEDEKKNVKIIKKSVFEGGMSLINCFSLLSDKFFMTISKNTDSNIIFKVYDNEIKFCLCYNFIMENNNDTLEIKKFVKVK